MPQFVLQFPIGQVRDLASRYQYAKDEGVIAIGQAARDRGYYTFDEFVTVCRWKTPRSGSYVRRNRPGGVEEATRVALSDDTDERLRLKMLRSLHGVEAPTASVLLHLAYPERYPGILDVRTLEALGVPRAPIPYSFALWDAYRRECLRLAGEAGVDGRTLDRALWQWSKEQGENPRDPRRDPSMNRALAFTLLALASGASSLIACLVSQGFGCARATLSPVPKAALDAPPENDG